MRTNERINMLREIIEADIRKGDRVTLQDARHGEVTGEVRALRICQLHFNRYGEQKATRSTGPSYWTIELDVVTDKWLITSLDFSGLVNHEDTSRRRAKPYNKYLDKFEE